MTSLVYLFIYLFTFLFHLVGMRTGVIEPKPSCDPNPCHPGVTCTMTVNGIRCGPCPQGMEGNGTHCSDIDEVGFITGNQTARLFLFDQCEIYSRRVFVLLSEDHKCVGSKIALSPVKQKYASNPLYASVRVCMWKRVESAFKKIWFHVSWRKRVNLHPTWLVTFLRERLLVDRNTGNPAILTIFYR